MQFLLGTGRIQRQVSCWAQKLRRRQPTRSLRSSWSALASRLTTLIRETGKLGRFGLTFHRKMRNHHEPPIFRYSMSFRMSTGPKFVIGGPKMKTNRGLSRADYWLSISIRFIVEETWRKTSRPLILAWLDCFESTCRKHCRLSLSHQTPREDFALPAAQS